MKKSLNFALSFTLLLSMITPAQATDSQRYDHDHHAGSVSLQNSDTRFGSPAEFRSNTFRRTYKLQLADTGFERSTTLAIGRNSIVNFNFTNHSAQDLLVVLGDAATINSFINAYKKNPGLATQDFHVTQVNAGKTANLAWQFDTFRVRKVELVTLTTDGNRQPNTLTVHVANATDKNWRQQ